MRGGVVSKGRCAGCGTVASESVILRHFGACKDYSNLLAVAPNLALSPGEEFLRWSADKTLTTTFR